MPAPDASQRSDGTTALGKAELLPDWITPELCERVAGIRRKVWEKQNRGIQLECLKASTLQHAEGNYSQDEGALRNIREHLDYIFEGVGTARGDIEIPMRIRKLLNVTPCVFTMYPGLGGHESLSQYDIVLSGRYSEVQSRAEVDLRSQLTRSASSRISLPLAVSNMRAAIGEQLAEEMVSLGLIPIFHRFRRPTRADDVDTESPSVQSQTEADTEKFEWLRRFGDRAYFSCGTREDSISFTKRLIQEGAAGVCVDVAIGNSLATAATVCVLRDFIDQGGFQCQIIAGNVDSAEGYLLLALAGADCIKVGIGPGSACTTRVLTRAGSGQGSALMDVARARFMLGADGPPFIADGGIEGPGDALTALALGAHSVMIGKLAARSKESGGLKRTINDREHVWYFGEASWWARKYEQGGVRDGYGVEGKAEWLPVQSSFREVFQEFKGGLTNAFPYYDVRTVDALHEKFCIPQQLCRVILGSTTGIHRAAAGTARESGTRLA